MKKMIVFGICLCAAVTGWAEQMSFVTTLSSAMGTFAQLETADSESVTTSPLVNFCNTRASVGTVQIRGANAYLQTLSLKNGTMLGGNTPEYRFSNALNSQSGGRITGGRLMATDVTVANSTDPKSKVESTLHLTSGKIKGARTNNLTIPGKVQTASNGAGTADTDLHWSNIYNKDYKCTEGACSETGFSSYTSYLLKSAAAATPDTYVHEPYVKTVQAAKVCGRVSYVSYCSDSVVSGDKEKNAYYYYADNITQTAVFKDQSCNMCQWGKPQLAFAGNMKKSDTAYTNPYNDLTPCSSGYTAEQLCQKNCDPAIKNCSFMCLKTPGNIIGCGNELIQQHCLCPCGTRPGEAACTPMFDLSWECRPSGEDAYKMTSETNYIYEPKLGGTGEILGCRAAL